MIARNKIRRVLMEQDVLASLYHPFVVQLHHTWQSQNFIFLCMEYCAGGEFFRVIQNMPGKRLSEYMVQFYGAEVLCALEYLHLMGFIYRDLKPENILLHENGHIMLTDFDLSMSGNHRISNAAVYDSSPYLNWLFSGPQHQVDTESCVVDIRAKSFVGTEEYIPPEMLLKELYNSSVDWWTFGILLYEMLHGYTPFKGKDRNQTFKNILYKDVEFPQLFPISPTIVAQKVSKDARNLICALLNKDPKRRLGAKYGAAELKGHSFFKGIQWSLLRNQRPPIQPRVPNPFDGNRDLAGKSSDLLQLNDGIEWWEPPPSQDMDSVSTEAATDKTDLFPSFPVYRRVGSANAMTRSWSSPGLLFDARLRNSFETDLSSIHSLNLNDSTISLTVDDPHFEEEDPFPHVDLSDRVEEEKNPFQLFQTVSIKHPPTTDPNIQ